MSRFNYPANADHQQWLDRVREAIIEPDLPIIDAHHHLWMREGAPYLLREFCDDLYSGHKIVGTVFAECHSMYRQQGQPHLQSVGESEFVAGIAAMSDSGQFGATQVCKVMFGGADLLLGSAVEEVLDAHLLASGGRFRGVRFSCGWDASERIHNVVEHPERLAHPKVRDALRVLEQRQFSLDSWVYHTQIPELVAVADAFPDLTIVLNHLGSPILGGPYRDRFNDVFDTWRNSVNELAQRPNVVMKLGALPIRLSRTVDHPDTPPDSAEIAQEWGPWVDVSINAFGARRCMFESNFPVHKNWCSYPVLWNAFKRMSQGASAEEKTNLFFNCANSTYRMGLTEGTT